MVAVTIWLALTSEHLDKPAAAGVYWSYLIAASTTIGLYWWIRRPASRFGPLLVVFGAAHVDRVVAGRGRAAHLRHRRVRRGAVLRAHLLPVPRVPDGAAGAARGALGHGRARDRRARLLPPLGAVLPGHRRRRAADPVRGGMPGERAPDRDGAEARRGGGQGRDLHRPARSWSRSWSSTPCASGTRRGRSGGRSPRSGRPRCSSCRRTSSTTSPPGSSSSTRRPSTRWPGASSSRGSCLPLGFLIALLQAGRFAMTALRKLLERLAIAPDARAAGGR